MPKYKFTHEFQNAVIEALGLKGRFVRKLTLEMEVNSPVLLTIEEYPDMGKDALIRVLELASFEEQPSQSQAPLPLPLPEIKWVQSNET